MRGWGLPFGTPTRVAAHEIPPGGGTKAARCAAYSAFTGVKAEFANCRFIEPTPRMKVIIPAGQRARLYPD